MTRVSFRHTMNHRDLLNLFRSSHRKCSVKKVFLKFREFHRKTAVLESLFNNVKKIKYTITNILKRYSNTCFLMKLAKFLRTPILKTICERLLLFASPQNTIKSGGEFGLDETSTECEVFF